MTHKIEEERIKLVRGREKGTEKIKWRKKIRKKIPRWSSKCLLFRENPPLILQNLEKRRERKEREKKKLKKKNTIFSRVDNRRAKRMTRDVLPSVHFFLWKSLFFLSWTQQKCSFAGLAWRLSPSYDSLDNFLRRARHFSHREKKRIISCAINGETKVRTNNLSWEIFYLGIKVKVFFTFFLSRRWKFLPKRWEKLSVPTEHGRFEVSLKNGSLYTPSYLSRVFFTRFL